MCKELRSSLWGFPEKRGTGRKAQAAQDKSSVWGEPGNLPTKTYPHSHLHTIHLPGTLSKGVPVRLSPDAGLTAPPAHLLSSVRVELGIQRTSSSDLDLHLPAGPGLSRSPPGSPHHATRGCCYTSRCTGQTPGRDNVKPPPRSCSLSAHPCAWQHCAQLAEGGKKQVSINR